LRGSGREGRLVARYADGALVRRRRAASEAWLKRSALDSYGVVHFATHALVDDVTSTNSALALAPGEGEDGFASPGELAALRFNAELVVLSACRTAGGPIVRGEGVQGLAAPLLAAGARAVAVTWWPIGDLAAIPLVERFYSEMAGGAGASDALRAAKLAAIAAGAPAREWAAFTIVGDPLARPALRVPQRGPPVAAFAGLAFVLLAAAYWVVVIRKRRNTERG
jgi:CHAT domain-containing protein